MSEESVNLNEYWSERLVGKYLVQKGLAISNVQTEVSEDELPKLNRVLGPGEIMTKDFRPNRLNVLVTEDRVVERTYFG